MNTALARSADSQAVIQQEAVLLDRWNKGDESALDDLLRDNLAMAERLALRLSKDCEAAEDIVSESLIRVHKAAATFNGRAQFKTWLYRIVVNCALDFKRRRRLKTTSLDSMREEENGSKVQMQLADPGPSPLDRVILDELYRNLDLSIARLEPENRELVLLFHRDDLPYADIAEKLHIPVGTVKSRLHRARQFLRRRLDPKESRPELKKTFVLL
jgi:RNA polymerase sigma-70 factor, ECF subfamily